MRNPIDYVRRHTDARTVTSIVVGGLALGVTVLALRYAGKATGIRALSSVANAAS